MGASLNSSRGGAGSWFRILGWGFALLILLTPFIGMLATGEMLWSAGDFIFAGVLILAVGVPLELVVRNSRSLAHRAAVAVALGGAFILVWVNAAVGIIGSEDNPLNFLYGAVIAIILVGALIARFRAAGMAITMVAAALAQAALTLVGLVDNAPGSPPLEILAINGFFIAMWLGSAALFREAVRRHGRTV